MVLLLKTGVWVTDGFIFANSCHYLPTIVFPRVFWPTVTIWPILIVKHSLQALKGDRRKRKFSTRSLITVLSKHDLGN